MVKYSDDELFIEFKDDKYGIKDKSGRTIIPAEYDDYPLTVEGEYIIVIKNNKYGLIDFDNNIVIPFEYDEIKEDSNGSIYARKDNNYYVFNEPKPNRVSLTDNFFRFINLLKGQLING